MVDLSLISSNFPDERTKYVAWLEAANGFGLIIGPPLGGLIYSQVGYSWTFYGFALILSVNLVI